MLRSGSICMNLLYNYFTMDDNSNNNNSDGGDILNDKHLKLKCLTETFRNYGGVLAKISQILCSNDQDNKVFSDCNPFSQDKTVNFIKNEFQNNQIFNDVLELDFNVYKSGSVGQVHKGTYKNLIGDTKNIILKVQYVGLYEQVKSDLYILDMISKYLFSFTDLTNAMSDMKNKMYEELDYRIELKNHQKMYKLWNSHEYIKIPEIIPEISNEKILGMYFIEARDLNTFIENSTQEERNKIGELMIEFVFKNIFVYNIFYSDIHYGNFLIQDEFLYVMDFGCLTEMPIELVNNLKNLYKYLLNQDKDSFYETLENMNIIKNNISCESKEYVYEYFMLQFEPLLLDFFEFTEKWVEKASYKKTELMKEWYLPTNMVYLNKIPFGLYHILSKLKISGNFKELFQKIIN